MQPSMAAKQKQTSKKENSKSYSALRLLQCSREHTGSPKHAVLGEWIMKCMDITGARQL